MNAQNSTEKPLIPDFCHTEAPWSVAGYSSEICDTCHIYAPNNTRCIATLNTPSRGSLLANAVLISAAPDLQETLWNLSIVVTAMIAKGQGSPLLADANRKAKYALAKSLVHIQGTPADSRTALNRIRVDAGAEPIEGGQ